jgi:hypothetical protein
MKINLHNYEAFFLDYKEGNLSVEQEKELFLFLEQHPHLYEELHSFENVVLEDFSNEEIFDGKNNIKKPEFTDENLIAYTEGILDVNSKKEIDALALQNADLKKELELYKSTILRADKSEVFINKSKLKRDARVIPFQNNFTFLRAAAAILLLVGLFFLVSNLISKEEVKNTLEVAGVRVEKQEQRGKSKEDGQQLTVKSVQLVVISKQSEKKQSTLKEIISQPENKIAVKNQEPVNNPPQNNVLPDLKDSSVNAIAVKNNQPEENINGSYFNSNKDTEDEEMPVTASLTPAKKSFFQKLVKAAKNVNEIGVKKVNAKENRNINSLSIGSFVVTESVSN